MGKPKTGLNRLNIPVITKRLLEPKKPPRPTQSSCGNPYGVMTVLREEIVQILEEEGKSMAGLMESIPSIGRFPF